MMVVVKESKSERVVMRKKTERLPTIVRKKRRSHEEACAYLRQVRRWFAGCVGAWLECAVESTESRNEAEKRVVRPRYLSIKYIYRLT